MQSTPYLLRPTTLYRLSAADAELLYIGIAVDWLKRLEQHARQKLWWPHVKRVDIEGHPDWATAIVREKPTHNVEFHPDRRGHRNRADLFELLAKSGPEGAALAHLTFRTGWTEEAVYRQLQEWAARRIVTWVGSRERRWRLINSRATRELLVQTAARRFPPSPEVPHAVATTTSSNRLRADDRLLSMLADAPADGLELREVVRAMAPWMCRSTVYNRLNTYGHQIRHGRWRKAGGEGEK